MYVGFYQIRTLLYIQWVHSKNHFSNLKTPSILVMNKPLNEKKDKNTSSVDSYEEDTIKMVDRIIKKAFHHLEKRAEARIEEKIGFIHTKGIILSHKYLKLGSEAPWMKIYKFIVLRTFFPRCIHW